MPAERAGRGLTVDGAEVPFIAGQSIAAALIAAGRRHTRRTRTGQQPRGLFCGIGVCFDCLVTVNGRPGVRACLEPATPGAVVTTQQGVDTVHHHAASAFGLVRKDVEIAVVGAGPAGLAAAVAAADAGAAVTIVDAGPAPGGQYLRQPIVDGAHRDWRHRRAPAAALDAAQRHAGIRTLQRHQVWFSHIDQSGRPTLHAIDAVDERAVELRADAVILATGAYDRAVPFPGWDLPGVVTAGAAQALLKGQGTLVGQRVLVAGTGPFLLAVAAALSEAGADVAAVVEANRAARWLRHLPAAVGAPGKLLEAARYMSALRRARIPILAGHAVTAASAAGGSLRARVARLDREWAAQQGRSRTFEVDALCVGFGFTPAVELAGGLGCALRASDWDQSVVVETDDLQRTSLPRVFAAGEITGVGGAERAAAQGRVAGLAAAHATGRLSESRCATLTASPRRTVRAEERFAKAMHAVYRIGSGWQSWLSDDVVLCRCEEVTVARARHDIRELGADDIRSLKLISRVAMGLCQGRVCGYAVGELLGTETGRRPDLMPIATRPIATPIPLGVIADGRADIVEAREATNEEAL